MLGTGERQEGTTLEQIRPDHRHRYAWVADREAGRKVVDAACGVGYGSKILADAGCRVRAYDSDPDAIRLAEAHYNHDPGIDYLVGDLYNVQFPKHYDAVVCFEALEHVAKPEKVLRRFHGMAPRLYVSVPNEDRLKFGGRIKHHFRHYKKSELNELLARCGWKVTDWYGQEDHLADVERDVNGRTLIAVAERSDEPIPIEEFRPDDMLESLKLPGKELPESICIVAMGASMQFYWRDCARIGGIEHIADEVWGINMLAGVGQFHRLFHQDDFKIQEARAAISNPERATGFSGMLDAIKNFDGPVYTSRAYDDYPNAIEYPLEWIGNQLKTIYINSTVAAALCLALAMRPKVVKLYGCDFSYPKGDRHKGEKGRACVEFWLGWAAANDISVVLPPYTNLLDFDVPREERIYGYDTEHVRIEVTDDGTFNVSRVDRAPEDIPDALTVERRYSHDSRVEQPPHL